MGPGEFFRHTGHRRHVPVDSGRFGGEALSQALCEAVATFRDVETIGADEDAVVTVGIEFEEDQRVRDAKSLVDLAQATAFTELADVVDAGAEAVAVQQERLAVAARQVVLLEDSNSPSRVGKGDAKATELYNNAYGRDRGFFDFYRSLQAMRTGLDGKTTSYVGPPKGEFYRFFDNDGDRKGKLK